MNLFDGDCLVVLKDLDQNSVDSVVTDPPAGISFMGKSFDTFEGRSHFIADMKAIFQECFRVMKPGAHGLVWAIPRTSHWTATALEDAGFEIRDVVTHLFGSGFPKSLDVSKAIDKAVGAEREVVSQESRPKFKNGRVKDENGHETSAMSKKDGQFLHDITAPATHGAKQWQGWGTALKPASEHWILVRKPISEKTVAANVLLHGTGGINIDASRIGQPPKPMTTKCGFGSKETHFGGGEKRSLEMEFIPNTQGRFPANLIFSHNHDCVEVGVKKIKAGDPNRFAKTDGGWGVAKFNTPPVSNLGNPDGTETVSAFECTDGCPVAELDRQSGVSKSGKAGVRTSDGLNANTYGKGMGIRKGQNNGEFGDSGGASRFFYCAKASKKNKNEGCEGLPEKKSGGMSGTIDSTLLTGAGNIRDTRNSNHHPTVKSTTLMTYLIKMITPPGGTVLDPFMGSGSTGVAAVENGFDFIGIEKDPDYIEIAKKRIYHKIPEFKKQCEKP